MMHIDVPPDPLARVKNARKHDDDAQDDENLGDGDGTAAYLPCKRKPPLLPRLYVVPAHHDFQHVQIGQHADQVFLLSNIGLAPLDIGLLALLFVGMGNPFAILADHASNVQLLPGAPAVAVTVRYTPTQTPLTNVVLQIPSNDPNGVQNVPITGTAQFALPVLAFLQRDGATVTPHVGVGLWNDAWNPLTGALYNGPLEASNFIHRDAGSFCLGVNDEEAASRGLATVSVDWWTRRIDHNNGALQEDDHLPGNASLTLTRVGMTANYVSKRIMLVTDADDAAQATHTGLAAGVAVAGAANHRLRRITVTTHYRLDALVRMSYAHNSAPHASPIVLDAPVFDRVNPERRRASVHLINVRATVGGLTATTQGELDDYESSLHSIYARAGIFLEIDRADMDPPPSCMGWAGRVPDGVDPGIAVAIQERSQNPIQIVPHPTQSALIAALPHRQAGHIYVFFLANIYDLVAGNHAGGEAFYASQTAHPANVPGALGRLNEQLQAFNLAEQLSRHITLDTNGLGAELDEVLEDAQDAANQAHEDNILLQSRAFWTGVENARLDNAATPLALRLAACQVAARLNPYTQPAYTAAMTAARGCAFVVTRALLGTDQAPAHEVTHILTDLNNAADGHFDLGAANANGPGHIDGKNLMHRHALDIGAPAGIALPKRLWDHNALNIVQNMNIPAQIAAIKANAVFVRAY